METKVRGPTPLGNGSFQWPLCAGSGIASTINKVECGRAPTCRRASGRSGPARRRRARGARGAGNSRRTGRPYPLDAGELVWLRTLNRAPGRLYRRGRWRPGEASVGPAWVGRGPGEARGCALSLSLTSSFSFSFFSFENFSVFI